MSALVPEKYCRPVITLPGDFLSIENDLGERPAGLGLLIKDPAIVSIVSLMGAALTPFALGPAGLPLSVAIAILGMNDCEHLHGVERRQRAEKLGLPMPEHKSTVGQETQLHAVDVSASLVEAPPVAEQPPEYVSNPFASSSPAPAHRPTYTEPKVSEYETDEFDPPLTPAEIDERTASGIPTPPQSSPVTRPTKQPSAIGVAEELVTLEDDRLRSWFITGPTGAGKGIFVTYALMLAIQRIPRVSVWGIDPKADQGEYRRWAIIPERQRYHFDAAHPGLDSRGRKRIEEGLKDLLARFYADKSPHKILWVDELPAIVAAVTPTYRKQLISTFGRFASMGRSRGLSVWIGSNAVGLRENGLSKSGRDFFHCLYLATSRSASKITSHSSFEGPEPFSDVFAKTGRAAWVSTAPEQWQVVPTLYADAVEEIPAVAPPANFGSGFFSDCDGAVASRELAEDLAANVRATGRRWGLLSVLRKGTDIERLSDADISQKIIPALQKHTGIISISRSGQDWRVSLPEDGADSSSVFDALGLF